MTTKLVGVVFALALAFVSLGTPAVQAHGTPGAYATTSVALNLRSGPGTGYGVMRVVPYGSSVYVNDGPYNGDWYKVSYAGTTGYVHGNYINPSSATSGTATTTTSSTNSNYSSKGQAVAAPKVPRGVLSGADAAKVLRAAGFTGRGLLEGLAITRHESQGWNPRAVNVNAGGQSTDRGLWQFNDKYHPEVSIRDAFDPYKASIHAFRVSKGGTDYRHWVAYTSGAYLQHMDAARVSVHGWGYGLE